MDKKDITINPSLAAYTCFKWLKSENCSSAESKRLARKTREALRLSSREYRKLLSWGREKVNVLERLMSLQQWDKIDFSKLPSKAGFLYRDAFARNDITAQSYERFAKSDITSVNADVLYPYDIAHKAFQSNQLSIDDPTRLMIQKYWDNLKDFYEGREENALAVVDTSGSMSGLPIEVAVSLGAYVAEKSHGPFANHFITFSEYPRLIEFKGIDIVDKLNRCKGNSSWDMNTNLSAVFDMLLKTAKNNNVKPDDLPKKLYIISDMEFDACLTFEKEEEAIERKESGRPFCWMNQKLVRSEEEANSDLEIIAKKWAAEGYKLPAVIFWNVNARNNRVPAIGEGFSYVSGFSPAILETLLSGKDGYDLMIEKLVNSGRYNNITA